MKLPAFAVVLLYVLALLLLTWPVGYASWIGLVDADEVGVVFGIPWYWAFLALMALSQAALLLIPVRVMDRRPVTKRHIGFAVATSALLMSLVIAGIAGCVIETVMAEDGLETVPASVVLGVLIGSWITWSLTFRRRAGELHPVKFMAGTSRLLRRGSILELLVAVPTHILARNRDYCCAGFYTFAALVCGLSIMLLAFGPAVYVLYRARWTQVQRGRGK